MVQSMADFDRYFRWLLYKYTRETKSHIHIYNKIVNCTIMFCIFKILQFSIDNKIVSPFFELQTLEISPVYIYSLPIVYLYQKIQINK